MVINASAAVTPLEQRPEKIFQALSWIQTHNLCDGSAVLSQLSYQSHMRVIVSTDSAFVLLLVLGEKAVHFKFDVNRLKLAKVMASKPVA